MSGCHSLGLVVDADGLVDVDYQLGPKQLSKQLRTPFKLEDLDALEMVFHYIWCELNEIEEHLYQLPRGIEVKRGARFFWDKDKC